MTLRTFFSNNSAKRGTLLECPFFIGQLLAYMLLCRQEHLELASLIQPAFGFDFSPVVLYHLLEHINANAGTLQVGVQALKHL